MEEARLGTEEGGVVEEGVCLAVEMEEDGEDLFRDLRRKGIVTIVYC